MKNLWIKCFAVVSVVLSLVGCSGGGSCANCTSNNSTGTGVTMSAANSFAFSTTTSTTESTQVIITNNTTGSESGITVEVPNALNFSLESGSTNTCTLTGSTPTYTITNTLAASGGNCQFTLTYYSALAITSGSGNITATTLNGITGTDPVTFITTQTMLTITPNSYAFGNITGSTESKIESFTVLNVNLNQAVTGVTESLVNESYFLIVNTSQANDCSTLAESTLNGGESCIITVSFASSESVPANIFESSILGVGYIPYTGATPILPANGATATLNGTVLSLNSPNILVKLITLIPAASVGNGSESPNQWQVLLNANPESMIITYENSGKTDATNFTVITSSLSSGYSLESNGCNGVTLESNESNTCSVLLNVATGASGEEDLALTPMTFSFIEESLAQPTVWLNPFTFLNQESVYVIIVESGVAPFVAESPAIYGQAGVTNTGPTVITGDVDTPLTPSSITGFPPGVIVAGSIYTGSSAQVAAATALALSRHVTALASSATCFATGPWPGGHDLSGVDLGTLVLESGGVYCFGSTAELTGTLVLSGGPTANYTFFIGSALTTASNSNVSLTNGTLHQNVFWDVTSAATFGTGTAFVGIVDASAAITDDGGSTLLGNAWSRAAAVNLNDTIVTP